MSRSINNNATFFTLFFFERKKLGQGKIVCTICRIIIACSVALTLFYACALIFLTIEPSDRLKINPSCFLLSAKTHRRTFEHVVVVMLFLAAISSVYIVQARHQCFLICNCAQVEVKVVDKFDSLKSFLLGRLLSENQPNL